MASIDNTMISTMNIHELAQGQAKVQDELAKILEAETMRQKELEQIQKDQAHIQKVLAQIQALKDSNSRMEAELKNTLSGAMREIEELNCNLDIQDETEHHFKNEDFNQEAIVPDDSEQAEQPVQIEDVKEQETSTEQDNQNEPEELLPSFADLFAIDDDTIMDSLINNTPLEVKPVDDLEEETPDPYEYRNKEEYDTAMHRAKMLQPFSALLSDDINPQTKSLGYNKELKTLNSFKQDKKVIDAQSATGYTLTTEVSSWIYISEPTEFQSVEDNVLKECA